MGYVTDISTGLSTLIAGGGLGVTFSPTTPYTAAQTGITWKSFPTSPDRIVAISVVVRSDAVGMPLGQVMIQIRGRGLATPATDVDDLLDSISLVINGLKDVTWGSAHIIQLNRLVSIPNGQDDNKRFERIDQYYADVDSAPTALRPTGGGF